jgi:integrase
LSIACQGQCSPDKTSTSTTPPHSSPAVDAGRNPQPRTEELYPFTRDEIDKIAVELGPAYGPVAIVGAGTGLRTAELIALERRDIQDGAVVVQRRYANGRLVDYPKARGRDLPRRAATTVSRSRAGGRSASLRLDYSGSRELHS